MAQTTDQHALTLVLDPEDDLATLRQLRALHARPYGQIVCEPSPQAARNDLALHLLDALGKSPGDPARAWIRAQAQLTAERIEHVVLLRAHLLSYAALRCLTDCTEPAGARLWVIAAGETPSLALVQLLERRAHAVADVHRTVEQLAVVERTGPEDVPPGRGPDFPLLPSTEARRRTRAHLARGLRGAARVEVRDLYDQAHGAMTAWSQARPDASRAEAADELGRLAGYGATGSETITRAHAGLHALADDGWPINPAVLDRLQRDHWYERRPQTHHQLVDRAAQIADRCPDPTDAALIALSAVSRCPHRLRRLRVRDLAPDASGLVLGRVIAVPPPLRAPLRAQQAIAQAAGPDGPLLAGARVARPNKLTMRRCYDRHAVPHGLRAILDGDHDLDYELGADGGEVLVRLHPANLFTH